MTRAAQERTYRVLLHALEEERRICGMDYEEFSRRAKELWQTCFTSNDAGDRR